MIRAGFHLCARATLHRLLRNLPWIAAGTATAVLAVPPLEGSGFPTTGVAARWLVLPCILSAFVAVGGICAFWPTLARDQDAASWAARLHRGMFRGAGFALTAALFVLSAWLWLLGCGFAGLLAQTGRLSPQTWAAVGLSPNGVAPILALPAQPAIELELEDSPAGVAGVELHARLLWDGQHAFRTPRVLIFDETGRQLTAEPIALDGTPRRVRWPARQVGALRFELQAGATAGLELRTRHSFGIGATTGSAIWNGGMAALGCLPGALLGAGLALMLSGMLALRLLIVSTMVPVLLGTLLDWTPATHAIEALAAGRRITPALWLQWSWPALLAAAILVGIGWVRRRSGASRSSWGGATC